MALLDALRPMLATSNADPTISNLADALAKAQGITPMASSRIGIGGMPAIAPAPTPYYGRRYNPDTGQMDSNDFKSTGFLGPLTNAKGEMVTELGASDTINGKEVEYPTVIPGLSPSQIASVLSSSETGAKLPQDVADAAYRHAQTRINAGLSPFWNPTDDAMSAYK